MPHELTAFLSKSQVPDRETLQSAVAAIGFDLFIHVTYRPFHTSGFLPCVLKGKRAGFEIQFDAAGLALTRYPHLRGAVGDRDTAIRLRWGEDLADAACALMVAGALAKSCGAFVHYGPDDLVCSPDRLVEDAAAALAQSESGPPARSPTLLPAKKPWWKFWRKS